MSDKMSSAQLTRTLRALASANNQRQRLRERVSAHSIAVYGVDPADIDCDSFIDACDGGCGQSNGMSAAEFDVAMRERGAKPTPGPATMPNNDVMRCRSALTARGGS